MQSFVFYSRKINVFWCENMSTDKPNELKKKNVIKQHSMGSAKAERRPY